VIATDNDQMAISLCKTNAAHNKLAQKDGHFLTHRLDWGAEGIRDLRSTIRASGGSCSLVVAADVLYDPDPALHAAFEYSLRALIAEGGTKMVVLSWMVRNYKEERFFERLSDLGEVLIVWRGKLAHKDGSDTPSYSKLDAPANEPDRHAPPPPDATDEEVNAWKNRMTGTIGIGVLKVFPRPAPDGSSSRDGSVPGKGKNWLGRVVEFLGPADLGLGGVLGGCARCQAAPNSDGNMRQKGMNFEHSRQGVPREK